MEITNRFAGAIRKSGNSYPLFLPRGHCGSCRVQLLEGEVTPLKKSAWAMMAPFFAVAVYRRLHLSCALDCLFEAEAVNINLRFQPSFMILMASPNCIARPAITTQVVPAGIARHSRQIQRPVNSLLVSVAQPNAGRIPRHGHPHSPWETKCQLFGICGLR